MLQTITDKLYKLALIFFVVEEIIQIQHLVYASYLEAVLIRIRHKLHSVVIIRNCLGFCNLKSKGKTVVRYGLKSLSEWLLTTRLTTRLPWGLHQMVVPVPVDGSPGAG